MPKAYNEFGGPTDISIFIDTANRPRTYRYVREGGYISGLAFPHHERCAKYVRPVTLQTDKPAWTLAADLRHKVATDI